MDIYFYTLVYNIIQLYLSLNLFCFWPKGALSLGFFAQLVYPHQSGAFWCCFFLLSGTTIIQAHLVCFLPES